MAGERRTARAYAAAVTNKLAMAVGMVGALALAACGGGSEAEDRDAGPADAAPALDSGADGGGSDDAGSDDAGERDAGDVDAAQDGGEVDAALECAADEHVCAGTCAANDSIDSCGDRCTACAAPDHATATCDGTDCGFACDTGFHLCDGACIPESASCGVPLPDACAATSECGGAGECIDARCVCAAGHRACPTSTGAAGCCPVAPSSVSVAGIDATDVQLQLGPDGTAYILVNTDVGSYHELRLHTRAPGGAIERAALSISPVPDGRSYDFAVRADGTVFVAVARDSDPQLHQWRAGGAHTFESIGDSSAPRGIALTLDAAQTVWVAWPVLNASMRGFSLDMAGTRRSYALPGTLYSAQADVEHDPTDDTVYAFWGHRYSGSFVAGVVGLSDDEAVLSPSCPADDGTFDPGGRNWAIHDTYSSIVTRVCIDGVSVPMRSDAIVRGSLPVRFHGARIITDGEGIGYVSFYEHDAYEAHWLASADGVRWSRGTLPIAYGNPTGSTLPGFAHTALARRPDGRVSIVIAPEHASMGPMTLVDLD